MNKLLTFVFVGVVVFTAGQVSAAKVAPARELNRIVAIVNDGVILQSELDDRVRVAKREMEARGLPVPATSKIRGQALDRLIMENLQLQLAERAGINIEPKEVSAAIAHMAEQNHMPLAQFKQSIGQLGISYSEYRQHIHDQMVMGRLQSQAIHSQVQLSDEDVQAFMRKYDQKRPRVMQYHLWDLTVPLAENADKALVKLAREQAQLIASRLRLGADISHVAQEFTGEDKPQLVSNDLGWRKKADLPGLFVKPAMQMHRKQVSAPIQAPNGFHVVQLLGTKDLTPKLTLQQARMQAYQAAFGEKLEAWLKKMRESAYVRVIDAKSA